MEIVHVINSLDTGGAETVLLRLLTAGDRSEFRSHVVSLTDLGPIAGDLNDLGVTTISLGLGRTGPFPNPFRALRLANIIRATGADVVQTWMYHADLIGGIIAKIAKINCIVWNVRTSFLTGDSVKFSTKLVIKICSLLSKIVPDKIITCSNNAALFHKSIGYKNNLITIDNGYDVHKLYPLKSIRSSARKELSIFNNVFLSEEGWKATIVTLKT